MNKRMIDVIVTDKNDLAFNMVTYVGLVFNRFTTSCKCMFRAGNS